MFEGHVRGEVFAQAVLEVLKNGWQRRLVRDASGGFRAAARSGVNIALSRQVRADQLFRRADGAVLPDDDFRQ